MSSRNVKIVPAVVEIVPAVLGPTKDLALYYQTLFGTLEWGESPPPPPYPSGPAPGGPGVFATRRLADPEARFWYSVMMAQIMLLPLCVARTPAEKQALNKEIAQILGLDIAQERGWIEGYTICWHQSRLPAMATGIRVRKAPGRRTRDQVLGEMLPHIRRMIKAIWLKPENMIHKVGKYRVNNAFQSFYE